MNYQTRRPMVLVNGEPGFLEAPMIPVSDAGFLHGDSIFTTLAVHEGRAVLWHEHLRRLEASTRAFGYPPFPSRDILERECRKVLLLQPSVPSALRLTLSRGSMEFPGIDGISREMNRVFLPVFREPRPDSFYREGTGAELYSLPWNPALDPRFQHKTGNLLWVKAIRSMKRHPESRELLLLNDREELLEGTISSIFGVDRQGSLRTAPVASGVLPGIMREQVIEWARRSGKTLHEQALSLSELSGCRELFLTSATLPVLPVHTVHALPGTIRLPNEFSMALAFLEDYRKNISGCLL